MSGQEEPQDRHEDAVDGHDNRHLVGRVNRASELDPDRLAECRRQSRIGYHQSGTSRFHGEAAYAACFLAPQPFTANNLQTWETPSSSYSPRLPNAMPDPATSIGTAPDTNTSAGEAMRSSPSAANRILARKYRAVQGLGSSDVATQFPMLRRRLTTGRSAALISLRLGEIRTEGSDGLA